VLAPAFMRLSASILAFDAFFRFRPNHQSTLSHALSRPLSDRRCRCGSSARITGVAILEEGGNAVDAAVATSFALSVVRPYSCGVGGGGFMLLHGHHASPDARLRGTHVLDYRETAPQHLRPDFFESIEDPDASTRGGRAVGIPGHVAGMLEALDRWGSLSRAQVLAPAIAFAQSGFEADAHYVSSANEIAAWVRKDASRERRFAWAWDRLLKRGEPRIGDLIHLPEQADLFEGIARDGRAGFYAGDVARAILDAIHADGGEMTMEDLASYQPRLRAAFATGFADYRVLSMPPPSSGGLVLAQVLSLLELKMQALRSAVAQGHNSPEYVHLVCEAAKHAFADRARWLADSDFVDVPLNLLLDPQRLERAANLIDLACTQPQATYGIAPPPPEDRGTSHLSVVDRWGNAVACTETINLEFGSLVGVEKFGFCLNDTIDDFAVRSGKANAFGLLQSKHNAPQPGKRPLSAMTPTIVLDALGDVYAVAGGSGGPRIISGTLQVLLNVMLFELEAMEAVSRPRFHHQWAPHLLQLEAGLFESPLREQMAAKGHEVSKRDLIGTIQLIRQAKQAPGWDAASDPRKGGLAMGY
jgi:gamma-glutamyltranspeptidase / glutathione hydrolase